MLQNTQGIVLRSVRYGETSLVTTIFTAHFGIQTYLIQGVRTAKAKQNRAGLLQPATLLELVAYQKHEKNLQRLREFQAAYIYRSLQEEVIKNSIALFSAELLLRLLPEHASMPELFDFCFDYFKKLDELSLDEVANFPLYFIVQAGKFLGYQLKGNYSEATPHLNLHEGSFSDHPPLIKPFMQEEDAKALTRLLEVNNFDRLKDIAMNASMRFRILDWFILFLQQHTQHLGQIRSLAVLQTILH